MSTWLDDAEAHVAADPSALAVIFPAVARHVGREAALGARVRLLRAVGSGVVGVATELYRFGDTDERIAVLSALGELDIGDGATDLLHDALRTNDTRIVAAALGPYGLRWLDDDTLAQAALKCVFMGVPLGNIVGLDERVTPELARMLAAYVHERVAAGRSVPAEVWPIIDRFPPEDELASITAELDNPDDQRRQAAADALAARLGER